MSALQQHKLFVFYLKWEGAMDTLTSMIVILWKKYFYTWYFGLRYHKFDREPKVKEQVL